MPEYVGPPDPAVIAAISASQQYDNVKAATESTLRALHARRDHVDVLIAMLEAERTMQGNK